MPPTTVPTDKQLSANGAWTWKVDDVFRDPNRPRLRDTDGLWEAVRRLSCPTLLINGAESDILEPDAAQRMVAAMPHGQLATVSELAIRSWATTLMAFIRP